MRLWKKKLGIMLCLIVLMPFLGMSLINCGGGGDGGDDSYTKYDNGVVLKTFHLNYTADKNWDLCGERDYVVFDMFDTTQADFERCADMGAVMICYFSSQYEDWRPDASLFGGLGGLLDGWPGENWVDPGDPKNLEVMYNRLTLAKEKGCSVIDLDNIDHSGHETYILNIFEEARARDLQVSQKNNIEKIDFFYNYVDMYQNEQCQQYEECGAYDSIGKPVFNIEYNSNCQELPYLFSVIKDVNAMGKEFTLCN